MSALPGALPNALAVAAVVLATLGIGSYALRLVRTTGDLLVASRSVTPLWNASAVSGEYLSAASFLGVAGLVLLQGADALWYPVGFVAGYLVLLMFVAAPLRRSGAYTLPDFAMARLGGAGLRRLCSLLVVLLGWLYLLPQLQGAGLTLRLATGAPTWAGAALVAVVVVVNVAGGGMRSATFVQAFQYWLKLTALAVPALLLVMAWQNDGAPSPATPDVPTTRSVATVTLDVDVTVLAEPPVLVSLDGVPRRLSGRTVLAAGTTVTLPAGTPVPHVVGSPARDGAQWVQPLSGDDGTHPLYTTYALVLATFLGTMGLPHVLVRFYTNVDGVAARRTAVGVLALLGAFYLLPTVYGALGRLYTPELLLTGDTDAVVLQLPAALLPGAGGQALQALLVAGAFAAFLSTSSGLIVSTAGVLAQDVLGNRTPAAFRRAALLAGLVPLAVALPLSALPVGQVVGLAFALAASTFCPLLLLGIWWRGLTTPGAVAGMATGGTLCLLAVAATLSGLAPDAGWPAVLLAQPAAWTVPAAFTVMVVASTLTRARRPADVDRRMLQLHAPESLRG